MKRSLDAYESVVGPSTIRQLRQLGERLAGARVVNVNSTREGGGVAEILDWMVSLMIELGLDASWEVIDGNGKFFEITKSIHNGLQGQVAPLERADWDMYVETNAQNAERLRPLLEGADFVIIHDPQPAPLLQLCPARTGKWVWRAHIDISRPYRQTWKRLRTFVHGYDASIFSMAEFAQPLPHQQVIVAPSIDPLSDKNMDLTESETDRVRAEFKLDPDRPLLVQISRYDRFKDPLGVIQTYRLVKKVRPVQLVLAGGGANDDPEGKAILDEVLAAADGDPDIHVLLLPSNASRTINALQRLADIVLQKSTREGFGLTVTEALWKGKPVIGGDTGGIRLQVVNHHTGFLVSTPEGAAHRVRYLLDHRADALRMGQAGRGFVRENFLLSRHLREYLTLLLTLRQEREARMIFV
ncbi:MAG: glycosyltransferase [Candidatus Zixiibacteriota bacterium]